MKDERLEKLADVLVNYSTKVKKGDRVAISAEDAALPFIKAVARAAVKAGALVEYYIDVPDVDAELLKSAYAIVCMTDMPEKIFVLVPAQKAMSGSAHGVAKTQRPCSPSKRSD